MGKQIDADKLIEHFINKTPNGWLVPICENESRWTLEGIISEIEYFVSTVEAIPKADIQKALKEGSKDISENVLAIVREEYISKADYENRLKADMVAMLTEIQLEIEEQNHKGSNCYRDGYTPYSEGLDDCKDIIQQKINVLKAESEADNGNDD